MIELYDNGIVAKRFRGGGNPLIMEERRGNVHYFSYASRERLIKLFASIDWMQYDNLLTSTLTTQEIMSVPEFQASLKRFFMNIQYNHVAEWGIIWRVEIQRRGAPHLHMVSHGLAMENIKMHWLNASRQNSLESQLYSVKSDKLESWAQIMYVAKHGTKTDQDDGYRGRRWGRRGIWSVHEGWQIIGEQGLIIYLSRLSRLRLGRFGSGGHSFNHFGVLSGACISKSDIERAQNFLADLREKSFLYWLDVLLESWLLTL